MLLKQRMGERYGLCFLEFWVLYVRFVSERLPLLLLLLRLLLLVPSPVLAWRKVVRESIQEAACRETNTLQMTRKERRVSVEILEGQQKLVKPGSICPVYPPPPPRKGQALSNLRGACSQPRASIAQLALRSTT